MKFDSKDEALLNHLVRDGRISNRQLAQRVALSPSACLARVKRLEGAGVIVGYRALVARRAGGNRLEGWADIRLVDPSADATTAFLQLVNDTPEIVEAHRIAGVYDYAVRFCADHFDAWNDFRERVAALGCEAHARFSILLETLK